jgi:hypothetical protein
VITHFVVSHIDQLIISNALLNQLQDVVPVSNLHAKLKRQILAVDVFVDLLRLIEFLEVDKNLCSLLLLVVELVEFLDQADSLVVVKLDKCLVCSF